MAKPKGCCPTDITTMIVKGIISNDSDTPPTEFLLQEGGDFILLESLDKIGLE